MENSCRGYADVVLIARDPETEAPLGFFSGKAHDQPALLPTRFGNLVLGAVSPEGRGRGVFTDLTLGGLEWARDRVDILEIGTQFTNTGACRVYLGAGFRLVRSDVTLRLWMG
jgi:GNAT superfamily N-acetyltransferase